MESDEISTEQKAERWMRITVIGLIATIALQLFAWAMEPSETAPGYEETLALIEREIRVGSTKQEARESLEAHRIEYGYSSREDLDFVALRDNRLPKESPVVGRLIGILRDVKKGFITSTSYSIEIDIGPGDRVLDLRVIPIYTGP